MVKGDAAFIKLQNALCEALGLQHCLDFDTETTKAKIEANRGTVEQYLKRISDLTAGTFALDPNKVGSMPYDLHENN